jgi:hypothetical protein
MKTFVRITNEQVYKELCDLKQSNLSQHTDIMNMISGYRSQLARYKWALAGIMALSLTTLSWLFMHINK